MSIRLYGIEIGGVYVSISTADIARNDTPIVFQVEDVIANNGTVVCRYQVTPDIKSTVSLRSFSDNYQLLELAQGKRYRPISKDTRAGFTTRIIRTNRNKDTVTFWCGGQKITDSYKKFAMEYIRELWFQEML